MKVFKLKIYYLFYRFFCFVLKLRGKEPNSKAIIAAPLIIRNLGDQALLIGSLQELSEQSQKIAVIQTSTENAQDFLSTLPLPHENITIIEDLYPAFVSDFSFLERLKLFLLLSKYESCFIIGADILDGSYNQDEARIIFDIAKLVSTLGVCVRIVSASFSRDISEETKNGLANLPEEVNLYCRDVYSQERVEPYFNAELSADAAFLMKPAIYSSFYNFERDDTDLVIGICLKKDDLKNEEEKLCFVKDLSELVLSQKKITFLALPHYHTDLDEMIELFNSSTLLSESVVFPSSMPLAPDVKYMCGFCDLVITGRMHVAIASLGMGVPPICFSYNNKFAGLVKFFDLDPDAFVFKSYNEQFKESILSVISNERLLKNTIKAALVNVKAFSKKNFQ